MGIRRIETTIGDDVWETNTLSATKGLEILPQLLAIAGEPAGELGAAVMRDRDRKPGRRGEDGDDEDEGGERADDDPLRGLGLGDERALARAISALTDRLAKANVPSIVKTLLKDLHKNSSRVAFDDEFSGNYGVLSQLAAWAAKENFQSFFTGNAAVARLGTLVAAPFQHPRTSTGGSGASS